ncbi:MAG: 3-deoxy-7-phosphoheptulonate synthase, partial [Thermotogota bacterium]
GSRNSQNFELLKLAGKQNKPVLLKRGFMNTIEEFLFSAEYIANEGNKNIILCERGIRTFEPSTRNTLDINSIAMISQNLKVPIISDPSHAAGRRDLIEKLSYSSYWAGAVGIMLEIHPNPDKAISDGQQTIDFKTFENIIKRIKEFKEQNV